MNFLLGTRTVPFYAQSQLAWTVPHNTRQTKPLITFTAGHWTRPADRTRRASKPSASRHERQL